MKKVLEYVTGREWATFVAVVTAALAEAPALAELVQGELNNGEWTYSGLIILAAGFVIRSKVWSASSAQQLEADKATAELRTLALHEEVIVLKGQQRAAEAVLEAARQGLPVPMVNRLDEAQQANELPQL